MEASGLPRKAWEGRSSEPITSLAACTQALPVERRIAGKEFFEEGRLTDEDQLRRGILDQEGNRGRNNAVGTEVPTHCINRDDWCGQGLLVGALVYYLTAAIEAVRGYVVAQVDFTGALFHGQSIGLERIVGTTHVTSGTRLLFC